MRLIFPAVAALTTSTVTANQEPLVDWVKGWINKAQSYIPSAAPSVGIPNPLDAGAAKVAEKYVQPLTLENWQSVLQPSPSGTGPEEWVVFVTGGNASCFGQCTNVTKVWNESVAILSTQPNTPNLAAIDCEDQRILCNSWLAGPPSLWHFSLPKPLADQSHPTPTVRIIDLFRNTTATDLQKIFAEEKWNDVKPYDGPWHPFEGFMHKFGVAVPLAYVTWAFSLMPTWLPMIAISFLSRTFM
ncbi:hypothetical protein P152DRAFT_494992 [Eremomyces bilateralis CBS 781.70]|uniref:Thioredoxin-like protein n=1 Tax=Eremomyces bilateralis CBS 781.70 TaxID=1392243 RepID=A0A6G1FT94_9PEZI|nr:uncharacterized protein P152DRAFT_494992 [Eremomyces bilateralis CBS 781.70]KAF1809095.1 hypothetical protein P152DRAFT_494992 [Eremomyces bilateralis CBS 781.70]